MKKILGFTLLLVVGIILVACFEEKGQLTRVDVQKVNEEEIYEDVSMITELEDIELIEKLLLSVNWKPKTETQMARKEDVFATLFYSFNKNMPERLYEYRIWFEENETATIISDKEIEEYGTLTKEHAQDLKDSLFK